MPTDGHCTAITKKQMVSSNFVTSSIHLSQRIHAIPVSPRMQPLNSLSILIFSVFAIMLKECVYYIIALPLPSVYL